MTRPGMVKAVSLTLTRRYLS